MALLAVAIVGLLRPAVSDASSPPPAPQLPSASTPARGALPVHPPTSDDGSDTRVSDFLSRAAAYRGMEAAVARAFGPSAEPHPPAARAVGSRVARGGDPQACLAQAVYYEARGEPADGQAAVAQVVLNRTRSGRHPSDVCGVVFEGAARPGCQFSFACDPRLGGRRPEPAAWRRAQAVASEALSGAGDGRPELAGVLNYHADYVRPRWAGQLERAAAIGRHIFYGAAGAVAHVAPGWTFAPATPASGA